VAWKVGGSLVVDQVLAPHMAIFHAHIHETCRYQIRTPAPISGTEIKKEIKLYKTY